MTIRTALFTYAIFMIVLLFTGGVSLYWSGHKVSQEAAKVSSQLTQAQSAEQASQGVFRNLESEQQARRADYDPRQTVEMSYKVQQAKEQYEAAMAQVKRLEPEALALQARQERTFLWLIPLAVMWLLHLVLAAMFRPQRDELAAGAARRKPG